MTTEETTQPAANTGNPMLRGMACCLTMGSALASASVALSVAAAPSHGLDAVHAATLAGAIFGLCLGVAVWFASGKDPAGIATRAEGLQDGSP